MNPLSAEIKDNNKVSFRVWAPLKERMLLHLVHPKEQQLPMIKDEKGYFQLEAEGLSAGSRYYFRPEGEGDYPDPASNYQPEGVHGPSEVVDHNAYSWEDGEWKGLPFASLILYELHVGTFTPEGTFEAIIPRLDELARIGINALELMPVAQFPGSRNWGYDGVGPYAVQNSYGGPQGLKKLVDACHQRGIAVFLDVVYNHMGPEGNYLSKFGPYFTDTYSTPWGDAINFDGAWSDGAREYFANNALYWFEHYHIDGLRCDAIHMVFDNGAVHFWEFLHQQVKQLEEELGRPMHLIAESDLNSPRVIKSPALGGYGFRAQWLDDFHHALYVLLNKKDKKRYYDFGTMEQLVKAYAEGFVHSGEWVKFRKKKHGTSSAGVAGDKFVVFNLNHDQIGNRVDGKRLCQLVEFERVKLAAAAIMLSPYIPMLFMGEEYGEEAPFYYFVSHSDPDLVEAVRKGRKEEFKDFGFEKEQPDPQAEKTFQDSKIQWEKREEGRHKLLLEWHQELIGLRQSLAALKNFDKNDMEVQQLGEQGFVLHRQSREGEEWLLCLFNLSEKEVSYTFPFWSGQKLLDSRDSRWMPATDQAEKRHPVQVEESQVLTLLPLSLVIYGSKQL